MLIAPSDVRDLAIVALVAVAPLAIVVIVALLRGYTINLQLTKNGVHRRGDRE